MTDNVEWASAEFAAGNHFRSIQFAQYALAQNPDDFDALCILGQASLSLGEVIAGVDSLEQAALIRPLPIEASVALAIGYGTLRRRTLSRDLLMSIAVGGQADSNTLLRIAVGLEAIDEPRLAMEACRQAGKLSPESADVHYHMGYYASMCGHPASVSEALLRHAIDLAPDNIHYRIGLVSMLIRVDRPNEAITLLDPVVPSRLDEIDCQCCLKRIANLLFDCDDIERAKLCSQRLAWLQHHDAPSGVTS